ncbi:NAD(P)-dependent oxidoreductase [Salinifilum aidingensis]
MPLRILLAGATGVVGSALVPLLRKRDHQVTALIRDRDEHVEGADEFVIADATAPDDLRAAVLGARPDVVVDLLSDCGSSEPAERARRTARLRGTGSLTLAQAAIAAGARRIITHGLTATYRPEGHDVLDEESPLWTDAPDEWGDMVSAVADVENAVLTSPDIEGVVLRFGALYGPGTGFAPEGAQYEQVRGSELPLIEGGIGMTSFTHVEDAAGAVVEVLAGVDPGTYNVVDNEPAESGEWLPAYARMIGAPEPVVLSREQADAQLSWWTVHQLSEQRGASNFRLRETAGWRPTWPSWREGFASMFGLWPG